MIIKVNEHEIHVKSISGDKMKYLGKSYPALQIQFDEEITKETAALLLSGSFDILDDDGTVLGTHDGYNTLKSINIVIGKMTTVDQEIAELEESLKTAQNENTVYQTTIQNLESEIQTLEAENAELMFNNVTNEDYNSISEEEVTTA